MSFKQFSALRTLKGSFEVWLRKCLFSVTKRSAPTYLVYAAIKASAGLSPKDSYFEPNSKGTTKSSSIVVRRFISLIKVWRSCRDKLALTSSTIVLQIDKEWRVILSLIFSSKNSLSSWASRTKCKLFSQSSSLVLRSFSITSSLVMSLLLFKTFHLALYIV